jgi:hypothetical protein
MAPFKRLNEISFIHSILGVVILNRQLADNVLQICDVAAYGKIFSHKRPSEVMKSKRTIYRKTSHEF